ncbi:class I SAM-dependent methyltransferase [Pseudoxanthomonas sp. z9]|uniref:class I SAM-dependent methyltransferase n=1 Tax=Pseudoxanthomonas sp. z9 TaxID=2584942 RepID=UPI0011436D7D|nr:class I SAM-dependent methyltransferase [Pseudoxanthomonas sp. z9]
MTEPSSAFSDAAAVARYAEGPPRLVPGFAALQRMVTILLAERAPADARVLVLGAGGGLELKAFAQAHPGWTFTGVDPAQAMLDLAARTLGPLAARTQWVTGTIDDAPTDPFDAGACLLTLHFLPAGERLRTLREVRRRLRPGAPFVVAHASFPQHGNQRARWLSRYAAFAIASGIEPAQAAAGRDAIDRHLHLLAPAEDEALLADAGFTGIELFHVGFTFRGWVAYA